MKNKLETQLREDF